MKGTNAGQKYWLGSSMCKKDLGDATRCLDQVEFEHWGARAT